MRIVYDYQIFAGQDYGGISRYFYEIIPRIGRLADCHTQAWAPLHKNLYLRSDAAFPVWGAYFPPYPYTGRASRWIDAKLCQWREKLSAPIDIWHETYFWEGATPKPRGAKVVTTVYDMIHELYPQYFPAHDPTPAQKAASVRKADHVICISHNTKRDLMSILAVPEEKISVTHLGFHLSDPVANLDVRVITGGKPYILYAGQRGGYKNFSTLLRAFAASSTLNSSFHLLCLGGGAFTEDERRLVRELRLRPESLSQINGDDSLLARLYREAELFVYPSLYEGFGIPPLEAMALDCPVLTSHAGSLAEVVGNAVELCDPHSIDSLREGMEKVLGSGERRQELVRQGRERVRQFSWQRCAEETVEAYRRLR